MIPPAYLDVEDLELLEAALVEGALPDRWYIGTVLDKAFKGELQIWRFTSDQGRGIIVTRVEQFDNGRQLFVSTLAGSGMVKEIEFIFERLSAFGRFAECRWISGQAKKGLARIYERKLGFDGETVCVWKELTNG